MLITEFLWNAITVFLQVITDSFHFKAPARCVHLEQRFHVTLLHVKAGGVDIFGAWQVADGCFDGVDALFATIDDPAQHAQIIAESGPQEAAILVAAKPVDMKHLWQVIRPLVELQPVIPIVAEVIAAKRLHGHRVTSHDTDLPGRRRGRFRCDASADQDAVIPVLGLVDEWCKRTASAAENNGADGYARRVVSQW